MDADPFSQWTGTDNAAPVAPPRASNPPAASNDDHPFDNWKGDGKGTKDLHESVEEAHKEPSTWKRYADNISAGIVEPALTMATGAIAKPLSDIAGLAATGYDAATGNSQTDADGFKQYVANALTYKPRTEAGQATTNVLGTVLGLPGKGAGYIAQKGAEAVGAEPGTAQIAGGVGEEAAGDLLGLGGGKAIIGKIGGKLTPRIAAETPRIEPSIDGVRPGLPEEPAAAFKPEDAQSKQQLGIVSESAEKPGGSQTPPNDSQIQARKDLLSRVGLQGEARRSAVEGNPQDAADDFDATHYTGTPMGDRMSTQFANERTALVNHAEGIVRDAGGTPINDQTTKITTGRTIAKPFDDLRQFINDQKDNMYKTGRERLGSAPIDTANIEATLNNPKLKNSLLAQGKGYVLDGLKAQLQDFKDTNGGNLNVSTAEEFRKFANTLWSTDKHTVGEVTHAVDNDVGSAVGEDVFKPARQMHALGKTLLDDPEGVSDLFDKDPRKGSVNRSTDFEDIPDNLATMSGDQFKNVTNTLHGMPEELQPQAQEALDAIRAHMGNRLLEAGNKTAGQWNKKGVNSELKNNSENYKNAFADRPDLAAKIKDLKDAGEVLRINSSYRGAHAQASNMMRLGVGVKIGKIAEGAGGIVGGAIGGVLGNAHPAGISIGAMGGKAAVSKVNQGIANRSLKSRLDARFVDLGP